MFMPISEKREREESSLVLDIFLGRETSRTDPSVRGFVTSEKDRQKRVSSDEDFARDSSSEWKTEGREVRI